MEGAPKRRVLLVDDESRICRLLLEHLTSQGFSCQSASSGKEALELLAGGTFDAILSDLRMPGMSGLELLEEVRKKHPHLAFLMATGVDEVDVGVQAMKKGADDYLLKPFRLDAVVASLQRALEKKRLEMELENYRLHLEEMVEQRTKQLQAAMKRIEMTYDETLEALGAALDLRDNETAGHSRRVTQDSMEIGKVMGVPGEQSKHMARGWYLHDIGKIGIPDAILLKPGKLTDDEREVIESHARIGYDLVSGIAFLAPAAEIVLTHQERYDGTGYPQGLLGEGIPLGSRIFAVSDALDAMTSDRPYRHALPFAAARTEIERESGRQFDPGVVKVFLSIPENVWEQIRREVAGQRSRRAALRPTSPDVPAATSSLDKDQTNQGLEEASGN